jgi:hypothetical protein
MTIPLGRLLPDASRDRPGRPGGNAQRRPYLVLLLAGLAVPSPLPETRCALTAPFHPDRAAARRFAFCGAIPETRRPRRALPAAMFPWSPDFPPALSCQRPSGALNRVPDLRPKRPHVKRRAYDPRSAIRATA